MTSADGCVDTYDINDESTTAFAAFDINNLEDLIENHEADPGIIEGYGKFR